MGTITAGDFRNGVTFEEDGQVKQVVEFQHVKPGKGAAFVRKLHTTPLRSLRLPPLTAWQWNTAIPTVLCTTS